MTPRTRIVLFALAGVAAVAVVASAVAMRSDDSSSVNAGKDAPTSEQPKKAANGGEHQGSPDRWLGPQGQTGQFVAHCRYSHSGTNDPIVHPNMAGMSHLHDFYGSVDTDEKSTAESLEGTETTCDKGADSAGYWHPKLLDHGKEITPNDLSAYYRAAPGVDPADVEPFPFGLKLLAGDQTATTPQKGEATGWTCGSRTDIHDTPPTCTSGAPLHLILTYPDCWDGQYLDSEDHISHAAYSSEGECPEGFGVHVPQLTVSVRFPISGEGHDLTLASGNIYSAHGDFFNAWTPKGLEREVDACIHRGAVCDLGSNRQEEDLFQAN